MSQISQSKIYKLHSWVKQPNLIATNQNKMITIIFSTDFSKQTPHNSLNFIEKAHKYTDEIPFLTKAQKEQSLTNNSNNPNNNNTQEYLFEKLIDSSFSHRKIAQNQPNSPLFHNIYQQLSLKNTENSLEETSKSLKKSQNSTNFLNFKTLKDFLQQNKASGKENSLFKANFPRNTEKLPQILEKTHKTGVEKNLFQEFLRSDTQNQEKRDSFRVFLEKKREQIHRKMNEISIKSRNTRNNESFFEKNPKNSSFSLQNAKLPTFEESFSEIPKKQPKTLQILNENSKPLAYFLNIIANGPENKENSNESFENFAKTQKNREKIPSKLAKLRQTPAKRRKSLDFLRNLKESRDENSNSLKNSQFSRKKREFQQELDRNFLRNDEISLGFLNENPNNESTASKTLKCCEERASASDRKRKLKALAFRYKNLVENMVLNKKLETSLRNQSFYQRNAGNFVESSRNFVENSRNFVENPGNYVENSKNFVENPGNFVENSGNFVENAGNFVENAGNFFEKSEKSGNFIEKSGKSGNFVEKSGKSGNFAENPEDDTLNALFNKFRREMDEAKLGLTEEMFENFEEVRPFSHEIHENQQPETTASKKNAENLENLRKISLKSEENTRFSPIKRENQSNFSETHEKFEEKRDIFEEEKARDLLENQGESTEKREKPKEIERNPENSEILMRKFDNFWDFKRDFPLEKPENDENQREKPTKLQERLQNLRNLLAEDGKTQKKPVFLNEIEKPKRNLAEKSHKSEENSEKLLNFEENAAKNPEIEEILLEKPQETANLPETSLKTPRNSAYNPVFLAKSRETPTKSSHFPRNDVQTLINLFRFDAELLSKPDFPTKLEDLTEAEERKTKELADKILKKLANPLNFPRSSSKITNRSDFFASPLGKHAISSENREFFEEEARDLQRNCRFNVKDRVLERLFPKKDEIPEEKSRNQGDHERKAGGLLRKVEEIARKRAQMTFLSLKFNSNARFQANRYKILEFLQRTAHFLSKKSQNLEIFAFSALKVREFRKKHAENAENSKKLAQFSLIFAHLCAKQRISLRKALKNLRKFASFAEKRNIYALSANILRKKVLKREKLLKIHCFQKIREFARFHELKYKNPLHLLHLIFEQKRNYFSFFGFWQLKRFVILDEAAENQRKFL